MTLVWTSRFTRTLRRLARRQPALLDDVEAALRLLESDPHHPALRTHKLKGDLRHCWACSAGYDLRIVFEFQHHPKTSEQEILLLTAGTHDEVY